MAFPAEPPAPPRPVRPVPVTIAVYALYALAAIQIISAILSLTTMGATLDAAREAVEGTSDGDTIVTTIQISSYVGLAFAVVFAAGFAVLGVFVGRGAQPARIVAWVALGLMLCCNGFGLLGAAAGGVLTGAGGSGDSDVDQAEVTRRIEDAIPGWFTPVNYVLLFLGIVASAAGIILLALPVANVFFRRREQVFEPPVPGGYYPASGAGAPGEPAQAGSTGAPPQAPPPTGNSESSAWAAPGGPAAPGGSAPGGSAPGGPAASESPVETKPHGVDVTKPSADDDRPGTGNPPPAL